MTSHPSPDYNQDNEPTIPDTRGNVNGTQTEDTGTQYTIDYTSKSNIKKQTSDDNKAQVDVHVGLCFGEQVDTQTAKATVSKKRDSSPRIRWAQSDTQITLQIYLTRVKDYEISIQDSGTSLEFSALLQDKSGKQLNNEYYFSLDLYANINEQKYYCYRLKRYLLLVLEKLSDCSYKWPRLTSDDSRNHSRWLEHCGETIDGWDFMHGLSDHQDFNKLGVTDRELHEEESDEDDDDDADGIIGGEQRFEELKRQIEQAKKLSQCRKTSTTKTKSEREKQKLSNSDKIIHNNSHLNSDIFNPFNKRKLRYSKNMKHDYRKGTVTADTSKNTAKYALDCKKTYLFIYNLIMFIMFLMVYIILIIKTVTKTMDDDSVRGAAFLIKLLTYTQLLESIHPMLGLVPGGPFMPFLQAIGRLLVNHFLADPLIRVNSAPNAHYLFVVWSSIEIFRYSFYALRVFKVEIYPLTWCRYTLFMPLYPMGGYFESQIIFATIKQFEKTGAMSVSLPNASNFSFNMPTFLKIYTYVLLGPSILHLMRYMYSQRCKQLAPKKDKTD